TPLYESHALFGEATLSKTQTTFVLYGTLLRRIGANVQEITYVHLLREKLELCNKDGAHATVVHLDSPRSGRPTTAAIPQNKFNISYGIVTGINGVETCWFPSKEKIQSDSIYQESACDS
ncbi:hypothetical protein L9F63_001287, partial [Diploptera punctata]